MLSTLDLFTDASGFHSRFRLQKIGQRRFAHTGGSCQDCSFSAQVIPHGLHTGFLIGAHKHDRITGLLVYITVLPLLFLRFQIRLVKADGHRNILCQHHNEKTVQKIEIRIRLRDGENHQRLIHIGRCRTHQHICPGKDLVDIPLQRLLVQHGKLHIVSDYRFDAPVSKNSFCLAGIYLILSVMDVIKARDSFNDFSCHLSIPFNPSGKM